MYTGIVVTTIATVVAVLGLYWLSRTTAVSAEPLVVLPFRSPGGLPEQHALSRYHVRWYLATLLFLAFDVEMLFMYPWAVVVAQVGAYGGRRDVPLPRRSVRRGARGPGGRGR